MEEFDLPSPTLFNVPEPAYLREAREEWERRDKQKILDIVQNDALDDGAKIDALAQARGWFTGDTTIIDRYMSNDMSAKEAAALIAAPIDEAYSTGNHRYCHRQTTKETAGPRDELDMSHEALQQIAEEDVSKGSPESRNLPTTEGLLWDLWYAVLHAAKRIPWDDDERQGKLVDLVHTLCQRPDPPPPSRMSTSMKNNWIWESGKLWSVMSMFGPSVSESGNDCPGCGAGWQPLEQRAWLSWNAFLARVAVKEGGVCYWHGAWELVNALEEKEPRVSHSHRDAEKSVRVELQLRVAAVWVIIAGRTLYDKHQGSIPGEEGLIVPIHARGKKIPWHGSDHWVPERWDFWRRRLVEESERLELSGAVRELAKKAAETILACQEEEEAVKAACSVPPGPIVP